MARKATDPIYDDDPAMVAYAGERGLFYSRVSMPRKSTQLLRHGNYQATWDAMRGVLPGGLEGTLMHWEYGSVEHPDAFTVVLFQVPVSARLTSRLVCHDRGLSEGARSNPDADAQVIQLDDKAERLESEAFVHRFTLAADHDTDENQIWQLFGPEFIDWLAADSPAGISFEIQDGSVCVFVPGTVTEPAELDALCAAAAKIAARVEGEGEDGAVSGDPAAVSSPGSRDEILERELAEVAFEEPPKDVKHAANAFRSGPIRTNHSWKLGEEAFFRSYAASMGLSATDKSAYRAAHLNLGFPGRLAHAAAGTIAWFGLPGFLLFSDLEDGDSAGWASIAVEQPLGAASLEAFTAVSQAARARSCHIFYDAATMSLCQDGGGTRTRTKAELDDFAEFAKAQMPALLGLSPGA